MKVVIRKDGEILDIYEDSQIIKLKGARGFASGRQVNYVYIYTATTHGNNNYDLYEASVDDIQVVMQGYIDAVKSNAPLYEIYIIPIDTIDTTDKL